MISIDAKRQHFRYATAGAGRSLFCEAWCQEELVFQAEGGRCETEDGMIPSLGHPARVETNILNKFPVDVLAIDEDPQQLQASSLNDRFWKRWIDACDEASRPSIIAIATCGDELVVADGLQGKQWRTQFNEWGYQPSYWFL